MPYDRDYYQRNREDLLKRQRAYRKTPGAKRRKRERQQTEDYKAKRQQEYLNAKIRRILGNGA